MGSVREIIVGGTPTLILALACYRYKSAHHAELGPVNSRRVTLLMIPIAFLGLHHVGNVDLPKHGWVLATSEKAEIVQGRDACSLGIPQREPIRTVSTELLQKKLPRPKILCMLRRSTLKQLHRFVSRISGTINPGDESTKGRIIVQCP